MYIFWVAAFGNGRSGVCSTFVRCERFVPFSGYYVLVMRLRDVYVMLSANLFLIVFDLAYDLSSEYSQLYRNRPLYYLKQYSI